MTNFEKVEFTLIKDVLYRLKKISEILNISLDKVINTSLLGGILPFWIPYQNLLSKISDKESPISEDDYQDILNELTKHMNSDFELIQRLDSLEDEFEEMYPFGTFADLQEREAEFIKFFRTYREMEEVKVEEVAKEPVQDVIKEIPSEISEEEEELPPSLFSKFKRFIKLRIVSHVNSFGDVIILGIFLVLLGLVNFSIFFSLYLTWPIIFDFGYIITTYAPWIGGINIIIIILLFPVIILLTGFFIGKLYYYFIRVFRKKS